MNASPLKFSIIVVVLNRKTTIQRCIDSVANQTYHNRELIIIDGGSSDGTIEIIKNRTSAVDQWISEPDNGIYNAMNKGVDRATGDWIIFLGADDFLIAPDVLERVATRLCSTNFCDKLVYGRVAVVSEDGGVIGDWGDFNHQILGLPHQGTFHHRSFFETHGRFDESFKIAGDYELLLRELKCAQAPYMPDIVVAGFSNGGVSTDLDSAPIYWIEYARAQRVNGIFPYTVPWCRCFFSAALFWTLGKIMPEQWTKRFKTRYADCRLKTACGFDLDKTDECEAHISVLVNNPPAIARPIDE